MPAYRFLVVVSMVLVVSACSGSSEPVAPTLETPTPDAPAAETLQRDGIAIPPAVSASLRNQFGYQFPAPPMVPEGELTDELSEALDLVFGSYEAGIEPPIEAFEIIGASGDIRAGWLLTDLLQLMSSLELRGAAIRAFGDLSLVDLSNDPVADQSLLQSMTDHLIAWDIPAHPGHVDWKSRIFVLVDPRWQPFFDDAESEIDWRHISWGGVFIDDRPLGAELGCSRGCIPALDDPSVTDAKGGSWYPDDALIFGVTVGDEARAYPKNIMEVHEMVNDTLGDRRIGIPYCTLCGSAQAYLTDDLPDGVTGPVLRTSGLITRSNKIMYDLNTFSVFDTFTGRAVSGSLRREGVVLNQVSVVTSTWGDWKAAYPDSTIVARDGGIGRIYDENPLDGRDDDGPIFPIGDVDERLPVQEKVLGVVAADGTAVAFPVAAVLMELETVGSVQLFGLEVRAEGSGVRAFGSDGSDVGGHEAFWFAWSQFHPETVVWSAPAG